VTHERKCPPHTSNEGMTTSKYETDIAVEERELVARARDGDVDAFYSLIDRHDRGLRGLAFRLLGDRDAMDDALQESYLKAFRALPRFAGDSSFRSWLYRIVYNTCLDELRRNRKMGIVPIESASNRPDGRPDPGDTAAENIDLAAALASLTPETRAAVLLVFVDGMDYRSATEVLGVSRGTLASRLHRGRAQLRRALDPAQGEGR
jgi:RNA polymerase sigma-70 factor (ECF subfamily)